MSKLLRHANRLSLDPGDVRRNAKLGLLLAVPGCLPYLALFLHGIEGRWLGAAPENGVYLLLLCLCILAAPVLLLRLLALALSGVTGAFWWLRHRGMIS